MNLRTQFLAWMIESSGDGNPGQRNFFFAPFFNIHIFVRVNSNVNNEEVFTNKTRIERYNKIYMVWDEDEHTTKLYKKAIEVKKLPRTGYYKF